VQVEIEALDPATLRNLVAAEIVANWDESAFASVRKREEAERAQLRAIAESER
jgi:hypothetical protein